MKLNIAYPPTGRQKIIELEDDKKIRLFLDKRLAEEVDGGLLGEEYKGYVFKIKGGNDKEGFPMKQGVMTPDRVRLLLREGVSCFHRYKKQKKHGARRRKSVRGCIISSEIVVVSLVIVKKGEQEIPDLTEAEKALPNRFGPKRASRIRKLFSLTKESNVKEYVIRREIPVREGSKRKKPRSKAPKIQRLITPRKLLHKRQRKAMKLKGRERAIKEVQAYAKLLSQRRKQELEKRRNISSRRKSRLSKKTGEETKKTEEPKGTKTAKEPKTKTTKDTKVTKTTKQPKVAKKKATEPKIAKKKVTEPKVTKKKATESKETKPKTTKPKETKPKEIKPKETKPKETKPKTTKPKETKPKETKAKETKPKETKPKTTKPKETKPKTTKAKTTQPKETKKKQEKK